MRACHGAWWRKKHTYRENKTRNKTRCYLFSMATTSQTVPRRARVWREMGPGRTRVRLTAVKKRALPFPRRDL